MGGALRAGEATAEAVGTEEALGVGERIGDVGPFVATAEPLAGAAAGLEEFGAADGVGVVESHAERPSARTTSAVETI
ncbi:MAG TPA: hypothetical protein VK656_04275, partial [Candidatus Acidoferrum sp.]|nr:hypothetical protein [Candidatus Acidoferrum sp.]